MGTRRSKAALKSFLRFSGSSAICFLLDYGLFTLLNSVLLVSLPDGTRELCATYGARIVSAVTAVLVSVLQDLTNATNLLETVIKIPVDGVLFLASYQIQKRWVFRQRTDTPDK